MLMHLCNSKCHYITSTYLRTAGLLLFMFAIEFSLGVPFSRVIRFDGRLADEESPPESLWFAFRPSMSDAVLYITVNT